MSVKRVPFFLALILLTLPSNASAQTAPRTDDGVARLLRQMETVFESGEPAGYMELLSPEADRDSALIFARNWVQPGTTRAAVQERFRNPVQGIPEGDGYELYLEVLLESGRNGRIATWYMDVRREVTAAAGLPAEAGRAKAGDTWRIKDLVVLTNVLGLYRLSLDGRRQFAVNNLTISAEDFKLHLPQGTAFVAEGDDGVTAMVLLGRGDMTFSPAPEPEKVQVNVYSGSDILERRFDSLFLRFNPDQLELHMSMDALKEQPVDPRELRRATEVFQGNVGLSYNVDFGDLSRDVWSLIPRQGDFVAEVVASRLHLSYIHFAGDQEDIRVMDRARSRTISLYASRAKLAARGRFYDEDDNSQYDILSYDIDASFDPRREWMEAVARLELKTLGPGLTTVTLSLAEPLKITSVYSSRLGHLLALRAGRNDVIVNLPEPLRPDSLLDLEFTYAGRLPAPPPEREALAMAPQNSDAFRIEPEPSFVYSVRTHWYPRAENTDYATARMRLRVPREYASVASGELEKGFPRQLPASGQRVPSWKEYLFVSSQPIRYLGWGISRLNRTVATSVALERAAGASPPPAGSYSKIDVVIEAAPLQQSRARELTEPTRRVLNFYSSLLGDMPFKSFTLAVIENDTPGGHSPAYFATLNQPPPATPLNWRNDPAFFEGFPEFFLAHELAHQWWGQAVGWKSYHEQWLSEGFAQYFAVLYAERFLDRGVFERTLRQLTRWTLAESDEGPVYLGSRLGHIQNDSRIFRALAYNKGALVLHMLRRLVGDEAFFRSLTRFYATWRFRKAGTEDLKEVFEAETNRPLGRFFERWIYNASLPRIRFGYELEDDAVRVRLEQIGEVFDIPVTVTLQYANARFTDVMVAVTEPVTEVRIPIEGVLRNVLVDRDDIAPAEFVR